MGMMENGRLSSCRSARRRSLFECCLGLRLLLAAHFGYGGTCFNTFASVDLTDGLIGGTARRMHRRKSRARGVFW